MKRDILRLYFIMGSNNVGARDPLTVLEQALQAGVTCFQLREKGANAKTGETLILFARACQDLCRKYAVPFIINDDINLAEKLHADGVHIGQDDANAKYVRARLPHKILGVSAHTITEAKQAVADGADYIGVGPIYATTSKYDAEAPCGTAMLSAIKQHLPQLPIVAIGGITASNTPAILATQVDGVSVISAIASADNIQETVQQFLQ